MDRFPSYSDSNSDTGRPRPPRRVESVYIVNEGNDFMSVYLAHT